MKRNKILGLCIALVLAVGGLAACSNTDNTATATPEGTEQAAETTIKLSGSTSVFPLVDALKDKFMEKNTNIKIQVEQGG